MINCSKKFYGECNGYCSQKHMIHFLKCVAIIHSFVLGSVAALIIKILSNL